jgi:hypothetical protein
MRRLSIFTLRLRYPSGACIRASSHVLALEPISGSNPKIVATHCQMAKDYPIKDGVDSFIRSEGKPYSPVLPRISERSRKIPRAFATALMRLTLDHSGADPV